MMRDEENSMFALLTLPRGPAPGDDSPDAAETGTDAFGIVIRPAPAAPGRTIASPASGARPRLRLAMG
jgi:hypothetical protein